MTDIDKPLVFIDCETTHLNPDLRRPWEIGMIRRPALREEDRTTLLVGDVDLSDADPASLKIGGFDERHISCSGMRGRDRKSAPPGTLVVPERVAAEMVYEWTFGAQLVGAIPEFDALTLDRMLRRRGLLPRWHHRSRCVESMTEGRLGRPVGGLRDCAAAFGIDHPNAHTAMGDALTAMAIYDHIMGAEVRP